MKTILFIFIMLSASFLSYSNDSPNKPKKKKAIVHIYRPNKIVGFGWVFNLKADGKQVAKIKNGKKITLEFDPGEVSFQMKKNDLKINLEEGKNYYLRASLVRNLFLGKPELVEVTESFAQIDMK